MSTGKRLAKRSILGSRVSVPDEGRGGRYFSGVIVAVKSRDDASESFYSVRLDNQHIKEYPERLLVGSGFRSISSVDLGEGQKVYLTFHGREQSGTVIQKGKDGVVLVSITPPGSQSPVQLEKKIEELRLLESRKSARLMDVDVDFARLADIEKSGVNNTANQKDKEMKEEKNFNGIDGNTTFPDQRKRTSSNSIEVPYHGSGSRRKRRPSSSASSSYASGASSGGGTGNSGDLMDECAAALVLMSLSCSPHSPRGNVCWPYNNNADATPTSPLRRRHNSHRQQYKRSSSPLSSSPSSPDDDDGIVVDADWSDDDVMNIEGRTPRKKKASPPRVVFQCTWPGCKVVTPSCATIEKHVRFAHLGGHNTEYFLSGGTSDDREEEFYYTEVELDADEISDSPVTSTLPVADDHKLSTSAPTVASNFIPHSSPSPPILSHMDMARPPHEDPEYRRQFQFSPLPVVPNATSPLSTSTPSTGTFGWSSNSLSPKLLKLGNASFVLPTSQGYQPPRIGHSGGPKSPVRKSRGESKKCRKVYGMEHREMWCTQCKWKKACSRFGD